MKTGIRGFTLIEVLISIAVLGIISTVMVLSLSGFKRKQDLESDKARITALMNEARDRAVANEGGRRYGVRLRKEATNESYQLVELPPLTVGGCYTTAGAPSATIVKTFNLKGSNDFIQPSVSGDVWDFIFTPLSGVPDPIADASCHNNSTAISISGSSNPGDQKQIIVNDSGTIINQ